MVFAKGTEVSTDKTEGEIKSTLRRYGATGFASYESNNMAMIMFEMENRRVVFKLPLPDQNRREFTHRKVNATSETLRAKADAMKVWDQACRERWRSLLLCIKAKLESVEAKIETFEDAFLAHVMLPDGRSMGEVARPAIASAYSTGNMPPLLPGPAP
jgi:hypothetical protein